MQAANHDYLIFVASALVAFGALHCIMRRLGARVFGGVWLLLGVILAGGWFFVNYSGARERQRIETMVGGMAPTYAQSIAFMGHARIGLETPPDDAAYLAMIEAQKRWLQANPMAHDIYTMRKLPDGRNVFIVDSETDYDRNGQYEGEREARTKIGEVYEEEEPGLERAFAGETNFNELPTTDRWGTWVSTWTPVFDADGKIEAVLGVDFDATSWIGRIASARRTRILGLAVLLVVMAGSILAIGVLRADIAKRKAVEENLRQSQQKLASRADQSPLAMIEWDCDLRVTDWNAAAEKLLGYTKAEAQGTAGLIARLAPESVRVDIETLLREGAIQKKAATASPSTEIAAKDGRCIPCEWFHAPLMDGAGKIIGVTSLCEDITERHRLGEQLRQAQKMDAVGQLAGGIAHDFNNLLCVIQGYTDLVRTNPDATPEILSDLDQIAAGADRAADLTRQLLTFSRRQVFQPKEVHLDEVVNGVMKMLCRVLGEPISLATHFGPKLPAVRGDAGMIEQVLLNLTVNARDAMPKGGRLVMTTSARTVTDTEAAQHPDVTAGPFICLEVADSGCGIPPENLPHIFEPFFTTKEVGCGTGLGLATVYGIIQQHKGWIEVDSERGRGTTFRIFLPAVTAPAGAPAEAGADDQPVRGGSETILLVEDESPVRDFVSRVLRQNGYEVLSAGSGGEALDVWERNRGRIDLVLTDMVMPEGMSGPELARRLQSDTEDVKVIYTSGYSTDFIGRNVTLIPGVNFIQKPFQTQQLVRTVRDYLDQ